MPNVRRLPALLIALALSGAPAAAAEGVSAEAFKRDLVGVPLCGKPTSGPLAGNLLCTVHLPDGSAILAGSGVFVRGLWETEGDKICRRNASDTPERRRCVGYEKLDPHRYRNSDGVEFCIGPCM